MTALQSRWSHSIMDTYGVPALALVRGEGAVVHDDAGRSYVDMLGGIAVNALGHAHPAIVAAVSGQIGRLGHVSNLYIAEPPIALAELLLALAGRRGKVYFGNSGAEAVEAAYKISRRTGRSHVVAAHGGFHGRTMGALSLTGQPAKADPFRPLPGPVTHVPYGDADALAAAVSDETAMVILEPIQGENGVVVPPPGYLAVARAVTARHGALLALDEVQTGIGRTGHWFAHQAPSSAASGPDGFASGVEPDIVTLAKGLGGGLPLGACIAFGDAATLLGPGLHGSTFGGNPVSCAAALAVLRTIARDGLLDHVTRTGARLIAGVEALHSPLVAGVRGAGLLLGIVLTEPVAVAVVDALRDRAEIGGRPGFLGNAPHPDVIRLAPPLILSAEQADAFVGALGEALDSVTGGGADAKPMNWRDETHARHFLRDDDLSPAEQAAVLDAAEAMAAAPHREKPLAGPRSIAVLFEKPSLRTRVSFEVAIAELGGHAVILDAQTTHLGRGETIEDAGRVLSSYVDAIVIRTFDDERLASLARASQVPVINALTDGFHPCQLLADLLTIRQVYGSTQGRTLAYVGDAAFNMANSYALAGAAAGMHVRIGAPRGFQPAPAIVARARAIASSTGGWVTVTDDPYEAVAGADVVATDTWTSMGQTDSPERLAALTAYQLNAALLAAAKPAAVALHCLPAHRGEEITDEVMDGTQSVVFQQAANRVPAQKAVLAWLLREARSGGNGRPGAIGANARGAAAPRDGSVASLVGSAA